MSQQEAVGSPQLFFNREVVAASDQFARGPAEGVS
jgi:hypothetical protein